MVKYAIIVAGGSGSRMNSSTPKQFISLIGRPVLLHTVQIFLSAFDEMQLIVVLPEQYFDIGSSILENASIKTRTKLVVGGNTRFQSVKNGLALVPQNAIVFVHDAVRCLVTVNLIHRCFDAALEHGNAIPAVPLSDTVRMETDEGAVVIDRAKLQIIQTPQTFFSNLLLKAFEQQYDPSFTDEATVAEKFGIKIHLIPGEDENLKLTRPIDLLVAENVLKQRMATVNR
jgi:2-C-methyl-D-erythritol 4-phosphate cytidylyltransferase